MRRSQPDLLKQFPALIKGIPFLIKLYSIVIVVKTIPNQDLQFSNAQNAKGLACTADIVSKWVGFLLVQRLLRGMDLNQFIRRSIYWHGKANLRHFNNKHLMNYLKAQLEIVPI